MYNYDQSFYSCALQFAPHNKPMMHFAKMAAKMAAEQAAAGKKVEPSPFAGNTMAYGASFGCVPTGEGSVLFQMLTVPGAKVEVGGMRGTAVYDLGKVEMKEVEPGFYQGEAHGWAPGFQYIEFTVNGVPTMNDRAPIGYGYSRAVNFCEVPGSEEEMNVYMLRLHADKFAYFFIAFAVYLLIRAFSAHLTLPIVNVLLYVSIAASLLASNVPRVMDIPLHYAYPVKCVEYFTFGVSVVCFIAMCLRHMWI